MAVNVLNFDTVGLHSAWMGFKDSNNVYGIGSGLTLAQGADAGSLLLDLADSLALQEAEPRFVSTKGDDGSGHVFILPPEENPRGSLAVGAFNANLYALSRNMNVYSDGDWEVTLIQPTNFLLKNMYLITNHLAKSWDSGSTGAAGYMVQILFDVQVYGRGPAQLANAQASPFEFSLVSNPNGYWPHGRAISVANEGDTGALGVRFYSPYPVTLHTFVQNNSDISFNLDKTPAEDAANKLRFFDNGTELTWVTSTPSGATEFEVTDQAVALGAAGTAGHYVVGLYQYSD